MTAGPITIPNFRRFVLDKRPDIPNAPRLSCDTRSCREKRRHLFHVRRQEPGFVALIHPLETHHAEPQENDQAQHEFVHLRRVAHHDGHHDDLGAANRTLTQKRGGMACTFSSVVVANQSKDGRRIDRD